MSFIRYGAILVYAPKVQMEMSKNKTDWLNY